MVKRALGSQSYLRENYISKGMTSPRDGLWCREILIVVLKWREGVKWQRKIKAGVRVEGANLGDGMAAHPLSPSSQLPQGSCTNTQSLRNLICQSLSLKESKGYHLCPNLSCLCFENWHLSHHRQGLFWFALFFKYILPFSLLSLSWKSGNLFCKFESSSQHFLNVLSEAPVHLLGQVVNTVSEG